MKLSKNRMSINQNLSVTNHTYSRPHVLLIINFPRSITSYERCRTKCSNFFIRPMRVIDRIESIGIFFSCARSFEIEIAILISIQSISCTNQISRWGSKTIYWIHSSLCFFCSGTIH